MVIPAESWPRFCMSSSIRGMSRETSPGPCSGQSGLGSTPGQVIDGRHAAFVKQFAHRNRPFEEFSVIDCASRRVTLAPCERSLEKSAPGRFLGPLLTRNSL